MLFWQKVLAKVTTLLLTMLSVYMGLCKYLINSWHSCEGAMRLVSGLFIEAKERSNRDGKKPDLLSQNVGSFFLYLILDLPVSYFLKILSFWLLT